MSLKDTMKKLLKKIKKEEKETNMAMQNNNFQKILNNIEFKIFCPITIASQEHLKDFVSNYLFNNSSKYFNNKTKFNQYYEIENNTSFAELNLYKDVMTDDEFSKQREQQAKEWLIKLNKYPIEKLLSDTTYILFKKEMNIDLEMLHKLCSYTNSQFQDKHFEFLFAVFHYNQEVLHLHRILKIKEGFRIEIKNKII